MQNNHQRWYDAALAHWQSEDPIAFAVGDANLYSYCGNDPVNWIDPSGLSVYGADGPLVGVYTPTPRAETPRWINIINPWARGQEYGRRMGNGLLGVNELSNIDSKFKTAAAHASEFTEATLGNRPESGNEKLRMGSLHGKAIGALCEAGRAAADAHDGAAAATELAAEVIEISAVGAGVVKGALKQTVKEGAKRAPHSGQTIYRVYGGDSAPGGACWTPVNPADVPNFRNAAGLPSGGASGANNTGRFVIEATIEDPSKVVKVRSALPLDGNRGGLPEYIIPDALNNGAVKIRRVSGVNPEL